MSSFFLPDLHCFFHGKQPVLHNNWVLLLSVCTSKVGCNFGGQSETFYGKYHVLVLLCLTPQSLVKLTHICLKNNCETDHKQRNKRLWPSDANVMWCITTYFPPHIIWGQFRQHFTSSFCTRRSRKHKIHWRLDSLFVLLGSACAKGARKTLVKSTHGDEKWLGCGISFPPMHYLYVSIHNHYRSLIIFLSFFGTFMRYCTYFCCICLHFYLSSVTCLNLSPSNFESI